MSRWVEAYENSNLEEYIKKVQRTLKLSTFRNIQYPYSEEYKRVKLFIDVTRITCKKVDPNIMPLNHVNSLAQVINDIEIHTRNYSVTEDPSHLQKAANSVDSGINHLQHISLMLADKPVVNAATLQGLIKKADTSVTQLTQKKTHFLRTINGLKRQVSSQEKKIKELDRDANKKVKLLEKQIIDFDKKFSKQELDIKKEFQSDQVKRRSSFNTYFMGFKKTSSNEQSKLFAKLNKDVDKAKTILLGELESLKKDSIKKHDELIDIVGLASGNAMRAQHKITSDEEEKSVGFWRKVSFGSFIVAVAYIGIVTLIKGASLETSGIMAPFLILLLSGAAYAARLAAGHRREAIRVRQFSLEMEAILPYLDALERSPEDSKDLRNKLAEKFFGNLPPVEANQHKNEAHLTDSAIQKISEKVTDIANSKKS